MTKFTFHVVNLPHTQTTAEYTHCAYTQKVRKFCNMMTDLGHDVYLYGSEDNEARVKEFITVITKEDQEKLFGNIDHHKKFFNITWGTEDAHWKLMNANAIHEMKKRVKSKDFICLIAGVCQEEIAKAFPENFSVEYGIGYAGWFSQFKVFESNAWKHIQYGEKKIEQGNFYDTVIPNYYDKEEFPFAKQEERGDYLLFIGRLIDRKGYNIAQQVAEKMGKKLILAGQGDFSGYGTHVGTVGVEKRGELMSRAIAVFVPTQYIEPFGGVHAEAMMCGTPVITTDFGVFTETVINGYNGQRCNTFQEFIDAVKWAEKLSEQDRKWIREDAQDKFSTDEVKYQYNDYFERLYSLWGDGWYQLKD